MTTPPDDTFDLSTAVDAAGDARIRITGDLDWDSADDLTEAARACLRADPPPPRLRLDCAAMTLCDSLGLAALLMVRREATAVGARLHLDDRPAHLERLLEVTGTAHVFTDESESAGAATADEPERTESARPPRSPHGS
ncbi:STAS domain-containing protein [Streptomyces sp. NPDC088254]|uniref:STAS domain-containing protein n=1 Tax=Streptomyces sp. NPDC088254 TaxID=3365847 RepID=UPI0037F23728